MKEEWVRVGLDGEQLRKNTGMEELNYKITRQKSLRSGCLIMNAEV